jgi:hypothetical protein
MTKSSSGSASVEFRRSGALLRGSATAGDSASIYGFHNVAFGEFSEIHTLIGYWILGANPPYTDDAELGTMETSVNSDVGAYLDFTTGEYHAGATTAAATLPGNFENCLLKIEQDFVNNETRFGQSGAVDESVTVADVEVGKEAIGQYVSNGADEIPFSIAYYRTVFVE